MVKSEYLRIPSAACDAIHPLYCHTISLHANPNYEISAFYLWCIIVASDKYNASSYPNRISVACLTPMNVHASQNRIVNLQTYGLYQGCMTTSVHDHFGPKSWYRSDLDRSGQGPKCSYKNRSGHGLIWSWTDMVMDRSVMNRSDSINNIYILSIKQI